MTDLIRAVGLPLSSAMLRYRHAYLMRHPCSAGGSAPFSPHSRVLGARRRCVRSSHAVAPSAGTRHATSRRDTAFTEACLASEKASLQRLEATHASSPGKWAARGLLAMQPAPSSPPITRATPPLSHLAIGRLPPTLPPDAESVFQVLGHSLTTQAAMLLARLNDLLKGDEKTSLKLLEWGQDAFSAIKRRLVSLGRLACPVSHSPTVLYTDASAEAVGAIHEQKVAGRQGPPSHPHQPIPTLTDCFHTVHVDVIGSLTPSSGYRYLLTCIDRTTHWGAAIPMPDNTAECMAAHFLLGWITYFGASAIVITDHSSYRWMVATP
ncbi:hypothetical protein O3P69_005282 [Scylla paramamosain]|uniref:Integrase catalytic domain-containing protein n=1 Tax=Scylla paramamosain TaxID=85552 RepID=A0AAW0U7Q6_SCYPA